MNSGEQSGWSSVSGSDDDQAFEASRNLVVLGFTTIAAFITLMAVIAAFNGVTSGGPFFNTFLQTLFETSLIGIDGPLRVLILIAALLTVSWAVDLWSGLDSDRDVSIGAPFWISLGIIALLLFNYAFPPWVLETFGFLGVVEFLTGMALEDINAARTALLGVVFLIIFWAVQERLYAAIPQVGSSGSANASSIVYAVGDGFVRLARTYRDILIRIGGALGTIAALSFMGGLNAAIDFGDNFLGQTMGPVVDMFVAAPGWGGYIASAIAYYANFFVSWVPVEFTTRQLGFILLLVFIGVAGLASARNVGRSNTSSSSN